MGTPGGDREGTPALPKPLFWGAGPKFGVSGSHPNPPFSPPHSHSQELFLGKAKSREKRSQGTAGVKPLEFNGVNSYRIKNS